MPQTRSISPLVTAIRSAREELTRALEATGRAAETHPLAGLAAVLLVWLLYAANYSRNLPLWHDELFTFFIAKAPTVGEMLRETRQVDLNPPLSYLLTRVSFAVFGVGTLQTRLPEMLGFAGALVGVFLFVRRRAGNAYGLLAAAALLASNAAENCVQARPYGLMVGFIALAAAAWQASSDAEHGSRREILMDVALFAAVAGLFLTHVLGLFAWAAIAAAEAVQVKQRGRFNAGRALALLLPLAVTVLYVPLLRNHGSSAFPASFQASPDDIFSFYIQHVAREMICLWLLAVVLLATAGRAWLRGSGSFFLSLPEWVATAGLIAVPFVIIFRLMAAHAAFFDRYGVAGSVGICILFTALVWRWTEARQAAAVVAAMIALLISGALPDAVGAVLQGQVFRHTEPVAVLFPSAMLQDPALPLVDASGLAFVEMNAREPAELLDRTYYLTGGPAAIEYAHATIFEGIPREIDTFHLRGRSEGYEQFVREHPKFYVFGTYDYAEDWLLRKLQADGAELRRIGRVDSSYQNHELYEVTMSGAAR